MLAFLVRDFDALASLADIVPSHIDFLRSYPHPFSVILTPRNPAKLPSFLPNVYHESIAFRISDRCLDEKIRPLLPYPCFLTSANKSGKGECYTRQDALESLGCSRDSFSHIGPDFIAQNLPSDIFHIKQNGLDFVRRNYVSSF